MAMLKSIGAGHRGAHAGGSTGHTGSARNIDDYLFLGPRGRDRGAREDEIEGYLEHGHGAKSPRPLAFGSQNLVSSDEHGWSREMDETRRAWGKDNGRTYYHFVISSDPSDHASAHEMLEVGQEWLQRVYPDAQAIVSVHDDNAGRIMHAHIVINAVLPRSGRKVQRSNRDVDHEADVCQDICRERGLGYLPYLKDLRRELREGRRRTLIDEPTYRTAAERGIEARGGTSWVAETREAIDRAVASSSSWDAFASRLEEAGYGVRVGRRGRVTFSHPGGRGGHDRMVRGERMGTDYTREGILARLVPDADGILLAGVAKGGSKPATTAAVPLSPITPTARQASTTSTTVMVARFVRHGHTDVRHVTVAYLARRGAAGRNSSAARFLAAVELARREGLRSGREVVEAAAAASGYLSEAEERERVLAGAMSAIEAARAAEVRARAAREEIASMPRGLWTPEVRRRRNALAREAEEADAIVERALSSSSGYLSSIGMGQSSDMEKLDALATALRSEHANVANKVGAARARAANLSAAVDALTLKPGRGPSYAHRTHVHEPIHIVRGPDGSAWVRRVAEASEESSASRATGASRSLASRSGLAAKAFWPRPMTEGGGGTGLAQGRARPVHAQGHVAHGHERHTQGTVQSMGRGR